MTKRSLSHSYAILPRLFLAAVITLVALPGSAAAQHFGRNKVQYDKFDFKILATEHFDIYYYPAEAAAATEAGADGRALVRAALTPARVTRSAAGRPSCSTPAIPTSSRPTSSRVELDEGTGGVTEGARRRIVLPLAATLADSDHVLGHELVHAFQYDMLGRNIEVLPLWFIEGMAEYLSLGPRDAQTAMWLRDAAIEDRLPTLDRARRPALLSRTASATRCWAYVGGRLGDEVIGEIMRALSRPGGADAACAATRSRSSSRRSDRSARRSRRPGMRAIRDAYGVIAAPTPRTPPTDYARHRSQRRAAAR